MSRPSDQECHEANTGGFPDTGDRKSRPFDEVVVEYERFVSHLKAMEHGDEAITTRRSEMKGSSTFGHVDARKDQGEPAEVSTSGDQDENEGVIPEAKGVNDPPLATPEELQTQAGDFSFPSSFIKIEDLVGFTHTFHLPMGHRVLIPRASDRPAYPPPGYVVIFSHHLIAGLRFPLPPILIRILNILELAPMQRSPNAYS
ncbi:hypothetical protein ACOSQ3_003136 [Xanthoceras sorbifolium]